MCVFVMNGRGFLYGSGGGVMVDLAVVGGGNRMGEGNGGSIHKMMTTTLLCLATHRPFLPRGHCGDASRAFARTGAMLECLTMTLYSSGGGWRGGERDREREGGMRLKSKTHKQAVCLLAAQSLLASFDTYIKHKTNFFLPLGQQM